jgi:hypothetical protein
MGGRITEFRALELYPVLRRAAAGLKDPKYTIAQQIGGATSRLQLTLN